MSRVGAETLPPQPRLNPSYPTLPASTPAALFALSLLGADLKDNKYNRARRFLLQRPRYGGQNAFVHKAQDNLYFWIPNQVYFHALEVPPAGLRWVFGVWKT